MPWHDISMSATGTLVLSFSAHFMERWNFLLRTKYRDVSGYGPLPPKFGVIIHPAPAGNLITQLCRSASQWSQGLDKTENSIQYAYIDLIQQAERTSSRGHI
jgi:phospholipase D1/2